MWLERMHAHAYLHHPLTLYYMSPLRCCDHVSRLMITYGVFSTPTTQLGSARFLLQRVAVLPQHISAACIHTPKVTTTGEDWNACKSRALPSDTAPFMMPLMVTPNIKKSVNADSSTVSSKKLSCSILCQQLRTNDLLTRTENSISFSSPRINPSSASRSRHKWPVAGNQHTSWHDLLFPVQTSNKTFTSVESSSPACWQNSSGVQLSAFSTGAWLKWLNTK